MEEIEFSVLHDLLRYDIKTGAISWKHRPEEYCVSDKEYRRWNTRYANTNAISWRKHRTGNHKTPFVGIFKRDYPARNIAYMHHHCINIPESHYVRSIDGDIQNLRISNLELIETKFASMQNKRINKNNVSGVTGVAYCTNKSKKWCATISVDGEKKHLGYFKTKAEAVAARKGAEIAHGYSTMTYTQKPLCKENG